jgi:hypothetical protein
MNQEVMRDFLNVPGIVGIALLSGHSEPVFYTYHPAFTKGNKSDLLQSVLQLVATIPPEYDEFAFHFAEYQIALHRLQSDLLALVIKNDTLNSEQFISALNRLRSEIATEPIATLDEFQSIPSSSQPKLKELIQVMNDLSQFTQRFLGIAVITNYWKSSRLDEAWLQQFQIDRSGQIIFLGEPSSLEQSVTAQDLESLRCWVARFIQRCSQAVRGYAALVEQQALTDLQKALLLP